MYDPRVYGMLEDIAEAQSAEELAHLEKLIPEYPEVNTPAVLGSIEERRKTLDRVAKEVDSSATIQDLMRQLQELRARPAAYVAVVESVKRIGRRYRFVHDRLDWTDKYQVHALMAIIKMRWQVGDVLDEQDILDFVEQHKDLLQTRQTAARIFQYYKGAGGFLEHGNFEKAY